MADNYLERKMEEHLSGRSTNTSATRRPQGLCYPLKPLRILVIAADRRHLRQYIDPLKAQHCRIAIINGHPDSDTDLGPDHGTRYYTAPDIAQTAHPGNYRQALQAIDNIAQAWRDIDAVVMLDPIAPLANAIATLAATRPYPNDWGTPVILVSDHTLTRLTPADLAATSDQSAVLTDRNDHPAAAHIPYLILRTSANIATLTLR